MCLCNIVKIKHRNSCDVLTYFDQANGWLEGNIFENMFIIYRIIRICLLRALNWNDSFHTIIKETNFSYVLHLKSKRLANTVCGMRESGTTTDFMDELSTMSIRLRKSVSRDTRAAPPGPSTAVKSMRWTTPL